MLSLIGTLIILISGFHVVLTKEARKVDSPDDMSVVELSEYEEVDIQRERTPENTLEDGGSQHTLSPLISPGHMLRANINRVLNLLSFLNSSSAGGSDFGCDIMSELQTFVFALAPSSP
ncbi:hypothetical protein Clacol_008446 [Clathrus columnatus]|uniref:Uncharacterized protein n=1 Tax=Clathrus columnatus TaxID=1419009 RepID=A0AAV5AN99_9AGAM|nr:hypothetical protein Clacol_008446 [Clathrus columnatus]